MDSYNLDSLLDLDAAVVFFPVRHHSPAAARLVRTLALRLRPGAILIEGPADFNDSLDELLLPHRLPIAIYSFLRREDGPVRGAYYPLCEHSPEWQALRVGQELGATLRFMDLPWGELVDNLDEPSNRYADTDFKRSEYIRNLCERMGVDDFHTLWDTLFELDPELSLATYLHRCHTLCGQMRLLEGAGRFQDRLREAYMAGIIRQVGEEVTGPILVVTGGYHSVALHARLLGEGTSAQGLELTDPAEYTPQSVPEGEERGIALTPYSFERLDSLSGYEAGMPNPGFYQQIWLDRQQGRTDTHSLLLERVTRRLRDRNQTVSTADLIAAETTARGLAALRGHPLVWRTDLVDGLTGAIIKDELALGGQHPLLGAIHEVLRGGERGRLAEGTRLPPLVTDIQAQLHAHDLHLETGSREIELNLELRADRARSRLLHRLSMLRVTGFERTDGTDWMDGDDLARVWERWRLFWNPDFDARCIEAARYGSNLTEATLGRLRELAEDADRDAGVVAQLLLSSALTGLSTLTGQFHEQLQDLIRTDGDFIRVAGVLRPLLYLFRYDAVLGTAGRGDIGKLLRDTYDRALWLLETLGQVVDRDKDLLFALRLLRETYERNAGPLELDLQELIEVLSRVGSDPHQTPLMRGASLGALWSLDAANPDQVRTEMMRFADPNHLGDFLTGLFALAREQVQRQRDLLRNIHEVLVSYSDEDFLIALPALRLGFTYFTPREKHHLALTLREALGLTEVPEMTALSVDVDTAARALAFESKLLETLQRYGVRGGNR